MTPGIHVELMMMDLRSLRMSSFEWKVKNNHFLIPGHIIVCAVSNNSVVGIVVGVLVGVILVAASVVVGVLVLLVIMK